jgi:nitrogen regulatory protein PII
MKLVLAIVPPSQLEAVRQALAEVHVTRLSIADGHGYLPHQAGLMKQASAGDATSTSDSAPRIVRHVVLEIAVNDDFLDRTVEVIRTALETAAELEHDDPASWGGGDPGGICVLPMDQAVQIYRSVRGQEAI